MKLAAALGFAVLGLGLLAAAIQSKRDEAARYEMSRERTVISTPAAPAAIGPYSQAVVHDRVVYTAGQIALDPATGEMVGGGDAAREAEQVMKNLAAVLAAAGTGFEHALRCDVFLADLADYAAVNEVYGRFFGDAAPARLAVQVARLPKDARVEIACIAAVP